MKQSLFISHANPEDNYFAAWLAAKLNVLGYEAWVDVEDFKAGDAFFTVIQPLIKDKAIRFIAVNSEAYIEKSKNQHTGVSRELNTAITVRDVDNFILPIRLDNVDFNDFPSHYASWNAIDFNNNWQTGLIDLVRQLEKMDIPKSLNIQNPEGVWFKTIKNENRVIDKEENYFSNWFSFDLPEFVYVHKPLDILQKVYGSLPYPHVLEAKRIITFAHGDNIAEFIPISNSRKFIVEEFLSLNDLKVDRALTIIEPRKKLVRLLNECFKYHLKRKGLSFWAKRRLNYFQRSDINEKSVSLKKRYGKGNRTLVGMSTAKINGRKKRIHWHYAINPRVDLSPFPHFTFHYTLVFTDENGRGLNKKVSRTLRRSVPADWYNRKWYETMLAAMLSLSDSVESEYLSIEIDNNKYLRIDNRPVGNSINRGYIEPA